MSYAEVVASTGLPPSQQPHADTSLLNTTPPTSSEYIDDTRKVNVVPMPSNSNPSYPKPGGGAGGARGHRRLEETKAESIYLWESAKHVLFRPGVAGGLIGLVNIGLMAGAARAFYAQPHYRRDTKVISSTVAATLAILGVEGFYANAYRKTAAGQEEERKAKEEGALIYRHVREQILRPGTLGGLVGVINLAILGAIGYFSYENWNRAWDRRTVSVISAGLLTLSIGEGFLAEKYRK